MIPIENASLRAVIAGQPGRLNRLIVVVTMMLSADASIGCKKDGAGGVEGGAAGSGGVPGGGTGAASKTASLRPKAIDDKLLAKVLGSFAPIKDSEKDTEFFGLSISAEKIRCNHSNHKDEYQSHPYAVAAAVDGKVVLRAAGGVMTITIDEDGGKYGVEASGICDWGIRSPYKRTKPAEGKPADLIAEDVALKRQLTKAKVGEAVKLPRGSLTLSDVKKGTWDDKDGDTSVLELKLSIEAPEGLFVDPFLAADIADVASTEKAVFTASCDESDSKGVGNPGYKQHREPRFDSGLYTAFGGHRSTLIRPGQSKNGWVTLLMTRKAQGKCKIVYDAVGLGGGSVEWTHSFD